jgi:hypothetical protein
LFKSNDISKSKVKSDYNDYENVSTNEKPIVKPVLDDEYQPIGKPDDNLTLKDLNCAQDKYSIVTSSMNSS